MIEPPGVARRRIYPFVILVGIVGMFALFVRRSLQLSDELLLFAALGAVLYCWSMLRVTLAGVSRPFVGEPPELEVSVVVAVYNEDPKLLERVLEALVRQTRTPERVWVIDDGSTELDCVRVAERWAGACAEGPIDAQVRRTPGNRGKRAALAVVFESDLDADVFFTIDSDTILERDAIERGLVPFNDPSVQAVAGQLFGFNWNQSLLTRLLDLDFSSSFLVGRAAMTTLGSVLVTCGSLAAYRASICREHAQDLIRERFLGAEVRNGDDRKLTQYALLRGKVVQQETCVGRVALPESLGHLVRQRTRWSTSYFRGTLWMLGHMPPTRVAFWLSLWHGAIFVVQTALIAGLVLYARGMDWVVLGIAFVLYVGLASYVRAARYLAFRRPDMTGSQQARVYVLSPLVSLLYTFVLVPVRYFALTRLRSSSWRTRAEVETVSLERVRADPQVSPEPATTWPAPLESLP